MTPGGLGRWFASEKGRNKFPVWKQRVLHVGSGWWGPSKTLVLSSVYLLDHIPKVKGRANPLNALGL